MEPVQNTPATDRNNAAQMHETQINETHTGQTGTGREHYAPAKKTSLGRQVLISLVVVAVIVGLGMFVTRPPKEAAAASPPAASDMVIVTSAGQKAVKIETAPVRRQTVAADLQASGLISYPADQTVKISPRVAGRVRQVYVKVGERVTAGETLAILESIDAATALATVRQNENKLKLTKSILDRQECLYRQGTSDVTAAQAALEQAKALTLAKKDVLARLKEQAEIGGFTQKPVEDARIAVVTAKSTLAQGQSDLAQAQRDNTRKTKLVSIGISSKSDLEQSTNVLEKAQVAVEADKEALTLAQQQLDRELKAFKTNLYADQALRTGQSDYDQAVLQQSAAEKTVRLAKTSILRDLEQARSDYQGAKTDVENSRIGLGLLGNPNPDGTVRVTAPASGLVIERDVNPGQVVDQSQETPWQMFVLGNATNVWVEADVYEREIENVRPGQAVRITVDALAGRSFPGTVKSIAPVVDPKTRAVKVRAVLANPGSLLKDGMFATMTLLSPRGKAVTVVPLAALQHDDDKDYVYVADKSPRKTPGENSGGSSAGNSGESAAASSASYHYHKRVVKTGKSYGQDIVILEGVVPGEQVVTHGALFLGDQANGG